MKRCWKCLCEKPLTDFYTDRSRSDGKTPKCKACCKQDTASTDRAHRNLIAKKYRDQNPEKCRESSRLSRQRNNNAGVRWIQNNPDKVREYKANNRHMRRSAKGKFTPQEVKKLFDLQRGCCAVCKSKLPTRFHRDHVVPLAKGGTNFIDNIQLLCGGCNNRKFTKDMIDFMQQQGYLL